MTCRPCLKKAIEKWSIIRGLDAKDFREIMLGEYGTVDIEIFTNEQLEAFLKLLQEASDEELSKKKIPF